MNEINPDDYDAISAAIEEARKDKAFTATLKSHLLTHNELLERLDPGAEPDDDREWRVRKMSEIIQRIKDEDAELLRRLKRLNQATPMNMEEF